VAPIHLMDPATSDYNKPFLTPGGEAHSRLPSPPGSCLPTRGSPVRGALRRGCRSGVRDYRLHDGKSQRGKHWPWITDRFVARFSFLTFRVSNRRSTHRKPYSTAVPHPGHRPLRALLLVKYQGSLDHIRKLRAHETHA
jgi:hypothetical protein